MSIELAAELERLAEKATPGLWEVDTEYDHDALATCGGGCTTGFLNYFVGADIDGKWRTLFDTQNSDHKLIEDDRDFDGGRAWDVIGEANTTLIVALQNNLPTILAALRQSGGWREMSSAPKDGTVVLLYKPNERMVGEYTVAAYWGEWPGQGESWIACDGKPLGYYSECAAARQGYPTHWQPTPEPPAIRARPEPGEG